MIDISSVSGVLSAIKAGFGLKNVVVPSVDKLTNIQIPDLQTLIDTALIQAAATGTPLPTNEAIATALAAINAAKTQIGEYSTHVGTTSGVNLLGEPNFITMAKTAQAAKDINGEVNCDAVLNVFGSITTSTAAIKSIEEFAAEVEGFIDDIPGRIETIQELALKTTTDLSKQVVDDVTAYTNAKLALVQYSVATNLVKMLDDKCLGPVLATIMTDELKVEIEKANLLSKQKITSTIYDE